MGQWVVVPQNPYGNVGSLELPSRLAISGSRDETGEIVGLSFVGVPDSSLEFGIFG